MDSGRTVNVARDHQRTLGKLRFEVTGELGAVGGLTGTLQTDEHNDGRRSGCHIDAFVRTAHQSRQLFVDDFDDLLGRSQAVEHIAAKRAGADGVDEVANDFNADVGFEQGQTDFTHCGFDVGLCQLAAAAEFFENRGELILKIFKSHR